MLASNSPESGKAAEGQFVVGPLIAAVMVLWLGGSSGGTAQRAARSTEKVIDDACPPRFAKVAAKHRRRRPSPAIAAPCSAPALILRHLGPI